MYDFSSLHLPGEDNAMTIFAINVGRGAVWRSGDVAIPCLNFRFRNLRKSSGSNILQSLQHCLVLLVD